MAEARWNDLTTRVVTAVALAVVTGGAVVIGGAVLALVVAIVGGIMVWELTAMATPEEPRRALLLAGLAGIGLAMMGAVSGYLGLGLLLAVLVLGSWHKGRIPGRVYFFYCLLILMGCLGMVAMRSVGLAPVVWPILVVIASDVGGYFGGRLIGGPKFWPRVSPKKTWSGTVVGWLLAGLIGAMMITDEVPILLAMLGSAFLAFIAQMGDIAESAIKRHVGVKDASDILPGHGGVLDRFDGMIAVFAVLLAYGLLMSLIGVG